MCVIRLRANVRACRLLWCCRGPTGTSVRLLSSNQRCLSCCSPSKLSSGTEVMWLASNRLHRKDSRNLMWIEHKKAENAFTYRNSHFYKYTTGRARILGITVCCHIGAKTSVSTQSLHTVLLKKHKTFPWSHYTGLPFHTAQVGALAPLRGPFNGFMRKRNHTFQASGLVTEINSAVANTVDA